MLAMSLSLADTSPEMNYMSLSLLVTWLCRLVADKSSALLRASVAADISEADKQMSDDVMHSSLLSLYKSAEIVSLTMLEMSSTLPDKNADAALS